MEPGSADFHNLCVMVQTELPPRECKEMLNEIETKSGRDQQQNRGEPDVYRPRTLDVDILLYDPPPEGFTPHEQVRDQAFVVFPLSEIREPPRLEGIPSSRTAWRNRCDQSVILEKVSYDWPREVRMALGV